MSRPSARTRRSEWIIIAMLLLLCIAVGFWLYRPRKAAGGVVAVISVDGAERYRVDLSSGQPPFTFRIEDDTGKPVSFEIAEHRIRFVDVTCPDLVCEKAGWCANPGDRAVCLPNKTTLICYDGSELEPNGDVERIPS